MRNSIKTILFLSAFCPVLLSLAYVRYDAHGLTSDVVTLGVTGVVGSLLPILILEMVEKYSESFLFEAKKIESNDFMLLAFVFSYLFPIIAKASALTMTMTVFFTIGIVALLWGVDSIPAHPILRLIRFRFYKVESSTGVVYILISRREIRDPKNITYVKRISSSMLMEAC